MKDKAFQEARKWLCHVSHEDGTRSWQCKTARGFIPVSEESAAHTLKSFNLTIDEFLKAERDFVFKGVADAELNDRVEEARAKLKAAQKAVKKAEKALAAARAAEAEAKIELCALHAALEAKES